MMNDVLVLNRRLEAAAWGLLLIWWGIADSDFGLLGKALPHGVGWLGIGLILLGLNTIRWMNGIRTNILTTILGILALVLGGLIFASAIFSLPFELPVGAILLIVLGVLLLVIPLIRSRTEAHQRSYPN